MTYRAHMGIENAASGGSVPVWPTLIKLGLGVAGGYLAASLLFGRRLRSNPLPWQLVPGRRDTESFSVFYGPELIGYVVQGRSGYSAHTDKGAVIAGPIPSPVVAGAIVYDRWMESFGASKTLAGVDATRPGYLEANPGWSIKQLTPGDAELMVGDERIAYGILYEGDGWTFYPEDSSQPASVQGVKDLKDAAAKAYSVWLDVSLGALLAPEPVPTAEGAELWKVFAKAEEEAEVQAEKAEKKIARRKEKVDLSPEEIEWAILETVQKAKRRGKRGRKWARPVSDAEIAAKLGVTVKAVRDSGIKLANEGVIYAHTAFRKVPEAMELRDPKGRRILTSQKKRRKRTMFAEHGPRGQKGHFEHKGAKR
jgi:hypothetical protein